MPERDLDEPVADVIEQHQEAVPGEEEEEREETDQPEQVPLEADAGDTAEQARTFELGEDDYR